MTEHEIQNTCISIIRALGGWAQRINSGSVMAGYTNKNGTYKQRRIMLADRGVPDIIACMKGRFLGIEIKKDKKKYDAWKQQKTDTDVAQHMQGQYIRDAGGIYICVYSPEQLEDDLRELGLV